MTPEEQEIYSQGSRYFNDRRWDEALQCFEPLIAGWPHYFPDIYNKLGIIYCHMEGWDKAVNYLERALAINPQYMEAALNLVIAYNELGRYEDAQQTFNKAVKIVNTGSQPTDPYIEGRLANEHARLADEYYRLNRHDEAISEYRKALSLRPRFIDIMTRLGTAYREKGDVENAIKTFQKVLKINPAYLSAKIHLGITYYMKGFVDMAIAEWEQASKIAPYNKEIQAYLSLLKKDSS
jgi:tetratricopeptide (TPR) repeat protein